MAGPRAAALLRPLGARADVPVVPDGPTARRWAVEELADPAYHRSGSLLQRLLDWVLDQLNQVRAVELPSGLALLLVVVGVLLVVAVTAWVAGPVRRARRTGGAGEVLAADDRRDAATLRAAADAAEAAGDHARAVAERFRALVRGLEERAALDELPGRTAHEAARTAADRLPGLADRLRRAGDAFDAVVYGRAPAGPADSAALRSLDDEVRRTRLAPAAGTRTPELAAPR